MTKRHLTFLFAAVVAFGAVEARTLRWASQGDPQRVD